MLSAKEYREIGRKMAEGMTMPGMATANTGDPDGLTIEEIRRVQREFKNLAMPCPWRLRVSQEFDWPAFGVRTVKSEEVDPAFHFMGIPVIIDEKLPPNTYKWVIPDGDGNLVTI